MPRWIEQRVRADAEEQVLAPPIERVDGAPVEILFERARNRPAKAPVVDSGGHDAAADGERDESAARGFDFGQFRHRSKAGVRARDGAIVCCAAEYTLHSFAFPAIRALAADTGARSQRRKSNLAHFRRFAIAVAISGAVAASFARGHRPDPAPRTGQMPGGATVPQRQRLLGPTARLMRACRAELMYRLLLGDVALQRGEPALAARAYLEAARETRDPTLARRATEIAVGARARALSIESARLWSDIDPAAQRPKQLIAALAGSAGTKGFDSPGVGNDLKAELERVLAEAASSPAALGEAFLQLNRLLAHEPDKQATLRLVESVAQPYPDLAEARFAVALAALNTGLNELSTSSTALREIDRALILKPGWERAAMLKGEILGKRSPAEAIAYLDRLLQGASGFEGRRRGRSRSSTSSRSATPRRARSSSASGPRTRPIATTSSRSRRSPSR